MRCASRHKLSFPRVGDVWTTGCPTNSFRLGKRCQSDDDTNRRELIINNFRVLDEKEDELDDNQRK